MKADKVRALDRGAMEALFRDIHARDVPPGRAEPGRRGRKAEGLASKFVRGNQERVHLLANILSQCSRDVVSSRP